MKVWRLTRVVMGDALRAYVEVRSAWVEAVRLGSRLDFIRAHLVDVDPDSVESAVWRPS